MSAVKVPADFEERKLALDATQSFICEAPAGSGKTELLTQRVLVLLARVNQPEEVLAITFTRKAAAEMRERILKSLHLATLPKPESEHEQTTWRLACEVLGRDDELKWQLQQNPSRLQILTFDSLCSRLTKSLPLHSNLGANLAVTENADELYRQAAQQLFLTLEQDEPWSDALAVLLRHVDNNFRTLENLFVELLQQRDQWLPIFSKERDISSVRPTLESHLQQVLDDAVQRLHELIPLHYQQSLCELASFAAANLERENIDSPLTVWAKAHEFGYELPDSDDHGIRLWLGLLDLLLTKDGKWRKSLTKNNGFPPGAGKEEKERFKENKTKALALIAALQEREGLLEALQDMLSCPSVRFSDKQWQVLEALALLLPVLVAYLQLVFRAQNLVDFSEISSRARMALGEEGEPTDLALRLDHRIQHILVDEFQDTSMNQLELLKRLTEGWQQGDGRTLFCVGDAMQSIYGFRGANVGLFLYCKAFGLGHVPLKLIRLTANFRSQSGVVDWFNRVFNDAFPAQDDISRGAVTFSTSDPFLKPLDGPAVSVLGFDESAEISEADKIVQLIQETLKNDPSATVAILVRYKTHVEEILPALQAAGLPYRAVDLESLSELTCIQDLVSLALALAHPANRIAWLSVLRAPWCGLELQDLFTLISYESGSPGESTVLSCIRRALLAYDSDGQGEHSNSQEDLFFSSQRQLSKSGFDRLTRLLNVFETVLAQRNRKPLRQWVEGGWLQLGGPSCLQNGDELNNVERFFVLLETFELKGLAVTPERLEDEVSRLFATPDPQAGDQIQVMSMHKSKGLEFDLVILPQLHRSGAQSDTPLFRWHDRLTHDGEEQLIISPMKSKSEKKNAIYDYLKTERKKIETFEACRLFYVACTRAKKRLYLTMQTKNAPKGEGLKEPARAALAYLVWPTIKSEIDVFYDTGAGGFDENEEHVSISYEKLLGSATDAIKRLPSNWTAPRLPEVHSLDEFIPHFEYANAEDVPRVNYTPENNARYVGTMIHQILHDISVVGLSNWREVDVQTRLPFWRARLINLGVPLSAVDAVCADVSAMAEALLKDENIAWMFAEGVERESEFAISCSSEEGAEHFVVDLLLIDAEGVLWLIDFKTSSPAEEEGDDVFLNNEMNAYRHTMRRYKEAVQSLFKRSVKTALYFPVIRKWAPYTDF